MGYKIYWSKLAIGDLSDIGDHIAKDNPRAAVKVGQALIDHTQMLTGFPYIGTPFPRYGQGRAREILCLKYRIFYRIRAKEQTVEILRIWHGARDEPKAKDLRI